MRPNNIVKTVHITLNQSYQGLSLPIEVERSVIRNNEKESEKETIYVELPPGIDSNERITLKGKGNVMNEIVSDVVIEYTTSKT